jgi:hypothetical protein
MWSLHAVIIKKDIPFKEARKIADGIIENKNKQFYRETKNSYRFRAIPKTKFKTFRTHKVNKNISLIFGLLK